MDDRVVDGRAGAQSRCRIGDDRPAQRYGERVGGLGERRIPVVRTEQQHATLEAPQLTRKRVGLGRVDAGVGSLEF